MRFCKKIKFWRKRNTTPPIKVDACVSTDDQRTCDAAPVRTEPTVMCDACTQTEETRMDSGAAAAATQVCERQPEINTQKILEQLTVPFSTKGPFQGHTFPPCLTTL
jgi:hypothetical protein